MCKNGSKTAVTRTTRQPTKHSVKQFLGNTNITVLEHPPYSPDLAPCDFYLFPKIKSVLKGTHFVSAEHVKQKRRRSSTALQNITCRIASNIGSILCSCVSTQKGTILKVIIIDFLNFLNRKCYRHSLVFCVGRRIRVCSADMNQYVQRYVHVCSADMYFQLIGVSACNRK